MVSDWALLYLHGFGSSHSGEKATHFRGRALARGIPFCSFDFRGHGGSDGDLGALTFTRNLEDVARVHAFLAGRGHSRVVLLGSSMGGATALAHAYRRRAAGDVVACLLIAPAVGMGGALERWAGPEGMATWRRDGRIRFTSELVDAELGWELIEDLRRHDFTRVARELATPTLILQGGRDASVDARDVVAFVESAAPGLVELVLWPDGDHRLLARKGELWTRMAEFLTRRGLLPPPPADGID